MQNEAKQYIDHVTMVAKGLYSRGGTGSGRSLKPTNHQSMVSNFLNAMQGEVQKNGLRSKPKDIATLGVFSYLPKNIAEMIHNRDLRSKLGQCEI
jgi:hypothetical protein